MHTFNTITEGHSRLRTLITEFGLCARLCNIATECDCATHAEPAEYNVKADEAIDWLRKQLPTFALIDKGIDDNEHSCILIKDGNIYGMGYITDKKADLRNVETLEKSIEPLQDNDYIRNLVLRYALENPEKCYSF